MNRTLFSAKGVWRDRERARVDRVVAVVAPHRPHPLLGLQRPHRQVLVSRTPFPGFTYRVGTGQSLSVSEGGACAVTDAYKVPEDNQ